MLQGTKITKTNFCAGSFPDFTLSRQLSVSYVARAGRARALSTFTTPPQVCKQRDVPNFPAQLLIARKSFQDQTNLTDSAYGDQALKENKNPCHFKEN